MIKDKSLIEIISPLHLMFIKNKYLIQKLTTAPSTKNGTTLESLKDRKRKELIPSTWDDKNIHLESHIKNAEQHLTDKQNLIHSETMQMLLVFQVSTLHTKKLPTLH